MSRVFDAESNVLGGCLLVPDAYWRCADLLTADDFSRPEHRALWQAIGELAQTGTPIDVCTVGDHNPHVATLALEAANATGSAANIRAYAEIVQREAITRRVRNSGQRIAKLAGDDALGEAQQILASCAPRMASSIKPAREFLRESVKRMQARCDATETLTGIPTSLDWLDEITSGWQRGDLILIGARPSVGKTALAIQAAAHAAQQGHPTLILSLEMAGAQLTDRLLSHISGVNGQYIRQPKTMPEEDWTRVLNAGGKIDSMPLLIEDTSALTLDGVCARVRQANAQQRLGLVVLDYLTMMQPPKAETMTTAWQAVTRGLKALAKDLNVPLILLSQFNRDAANKEPTLSSFRDTGALEQDADVAILLHRPDEGDRNTIHLRVAKQRNGPVDDCYLNFNGASQRFTWREAPAVKATPAPKPRGFNAPRFIDRSQVA